MEKKLYLFETITIDRATEESQEHILLGVQQMRQKGIIDFFINVPYERRYQFFIYLDSAETGLLDILKLFTTNKAYYRYRELI